MSYFVPNVSDTTGSILLNSDWLSLGIKTLAYDLTTLLTKPQWFSSDWPSISEYLGHWPYQVVLTAFHLKLNKHNEYLVTSASDGSKHRYKPEQVIKIINQLNPFGVVLPQGLEDFIPQLAKTIQILELGKTYVSGDIPKEQYAKLLDGGVRFIESTEPLKLASQGQAYRKNTLVNLKASECRMDFEKIEEGCTCRTCELGLTKAYLHHLITEVPGLFLHYALLHNISVCTRAAP